MDRVESIRAAAARLEGEIRDVRRLIHMHPEPGYAEEKTAALIADHLGGSRIPHNTGAAKTGVVGLLEGRKEGRTVLLRADMDALRKEEAVELESRPHRSRHEGFMHACGHDGHVAILLGVAKILAGMRDPVPGSVKFVFQPAEEGDKGGERMVREGVLRDPKVSAAFALHAWPEIEVGRVGFQHGSSMAASSDFVIEVTG
ncbi:MAG: M20 metallopeptidase family protein, partial [Planctomycetota bacterium]